MSILVIADHDNQKLVAATLNTVSAAEQIGDDIHILVAGEGCSTVVSEASAITAVKKVLHADHSAYAHLLAENTAALIAEVAASYAYILAPATTNGKNIMPRVAALLDVAMISDVTSIESNDTFKHPIYAGNAVATVQSSDNTKVMTIRGTAFDASETGSGDAEVETLSIIQDLGLSAFDKEELAQSDRPELTEAKIVISGGRGLQNKENFELLHRIADKLGAAVGASRAAVDAGFVPNDMQVGQTGKIVAPDLYIAIGISGAIQHLAGMKESKVIVAINKDEEAPIFQVADYGLVEDLFTALPEFEKLLD